MAPSSLPMGLTLEPTQLATFVRRGTGRPELALGEWHAAIIHGGATTNARVFRAAGQGIEQGQMTPWSLILKEWHPGSADDEPSAMNYWQREALAYQAGFLRAVPSHLRPAHCFGVHQQDATTLWLALEDIQAPQPRPWSSGHFAHAAEHLGQFNGGFLQQPLPDDPWLSRDWLRAWVALCEPAVLDLPQMVKHSVVAAHIPDRVMQDILRLWDERHVLLDALDRLPQTICHRDAFVRNLFVEDDVNGASGTVAIDWATLGVGPIGEDAAALVGGSLVFFELVADDIQAVSERVFDQYARGLSSEGWPHDSRQLRCGYTATLALRYAIGSVLDLSIVADDESHTWAEQVLGHSIAELIENTARNMTFFLACADEARTFV